jgi:hypothetical protein
MQEKIPTCYSLGKGKAIAQKLAKDARNKPGKKAKGALPDHLGISMEELEAKLAKYRYKNAYIIGKDGKTIKK